MSCHGQQSQCSEHQTSSGACERVSPKEGAVGDVAGREVSSSSEMRLRAAARSFTSALASAGGFAASLASSAARRWSTCLRRISNSSSAAASRCAVKSTKLRRR